MTVFKAKSRKAPYRWFTTLSVLGLWVGATGLASEVPEPLDYGSVYLVESRKVPAQEWSIGLEPAYEFTNPYYDVFGMTVSVQRRFARYFGSGAQISGYHGRKTRISEVLEANLEAQGLLLRPLVPTSSAFVSFALRPVIGHLNLRSDLILPFELQAEVGPGATHYSSRGWFFSAFYSVGPEVQISEWLAVVSRVGQEIEFGPGGPMGRTQARVGWRVRF